jgi:hypothetical protein
MTSTFIGTRHSTYLTPWHNPDCVEDHESRPTSEYYPSLANDHQLCTGIWGFCRLGDTIVFVCRGDPGTDLAEWKSNLLCLSVKR